MKTPKGDLPPIYNSYDRLPMSQATRQPQSRQDLPDIPIDDELLNLALDRTR